MSLFVCADDDADAELHDFGPRTGDRAQTGSTGLRAAWVRRARRSAAATARADGARLRTAAAGAARWVLRQVARVVVAWNVSSVEFESVVRCAGVLVTLTQAAWSCVVSVSPKSGRFAESNGRQRVLCWKLSRFVDRVRRTASTSP